MKRFLKRMFAGILTLAMVLGCVAGTGVLEVKAGEFDENLYVHVQNESGEGQPNVQLVFARADGKGSPVYFPPTNTSGETEISIVDVSIEHMNDDFLEEGVEYNVEPIDGYVCASEPMKVTVGTLYGGYYIDKVNDEEYDGYEDYGYVKEGYVPLVVKEKTESENHPEITKVTPSKTSIGATGGTLDITIDGTNLKDEFFYKLSYRKSGDAWVSTSETGKSVSGSGDSDTQKTVSMNIPSKESSSSYSDATAWKIGISTEQNGEYKETEEIIIQESKIEAVSAGADSIDRSGGLVTVTVTGEYLPDTLYYKLHYKKTGESGEFTYYRDGNQKVESVSAQGKDNEKEIEVTIPSTTDVPGATEWIIAVALKEDSNFIRSSSPITVDASEPVISKVSPDLTSINEKGGEIKLTVEGEDLLDTLYYKTFYKTAASDELKPSDQDAQLVSATGGDTKRKQISITLPTAPGDATDWVIGVDINAQGTFSNTATIKIERPNIATVSPAEGVISGLGGTMTVTVEGEYLPEQLYYKRYYTVKDDSSEHEFDTNAIPISTTETSKSRKQISIPLPNVSEKPEAISWIIGVSVAEEGSFIKSKTAISIQKEIIESVEPNVTSIDQSGGKVTVTVTGQNLPEELYYKRNYISKAETGGLAGIVDADAIQVSAEGSATQRTFDVDLPDVKYYENAQAWIIGVSLKSNTGFVESDQITIEGINLVPQIDEVKADITSITRNGGNVTVTVTGDNLPRKLFWKLYYTISANDEPHYFYNYALEAEDSTGADVKTRNLEIRIPQSSDNDIQAWVIEVALAADGTYMKTDPIVIKENQVSEQTKQELVGAVETAKELDSSNYTEESWKAYNEAVEKAKKVMADEYATEKQYQDAIKAVADAKAALETVKKSEAAGVDKDVKVKVTKITVNASPSKKIAAGRKAQLTAAIAPANASNKAVTWTTSNKKYAEVNANGVVTAKKAGKGKTVTITAIAADGSGVKATCKIHIMKNAVRKVTLKAKKSVKAGKSVKVKATVKTTGKKVNKKLKLTSSNPAYATVNGTSKVKTYKAGKGKTVKITATDGNNFSESQ